MFLCRSIPIISIDRKSIGSTEGAGSSSLYVKINKTTHQGIRNAISDLVPESFFHYV